MSAKHFKTDRRLWVAFGLVVFIALWFVPMIPFKDEAVPPYVCWLAIFKVPTQDGWIWKDGFQVLRELPIVLLAILGCSVVLSIPAVIFGWVLQGLTVYLRGIGMDRHDQAA